MSDLTGFLNGRPQCISIIICDEVIDDRRTGKITLVGLFANIGMLRLPAPCPRMVVVASFAEAMGAWPLGMSVRCPSGKELTRLDDVIWFDDVSRVINLEFTLSGSLLTEAGRYFVDVIVDGTLVVSRSFYVHLLPDGPGC